ncbi:MAG: N-acetyltransferase [Emcibacteraceae bacterium]
MMPNHIIRDARIEDARELAELVNYSGSGPNTNGIDLANWASQVKNGEDPFDIGASIIASDKDYYTYKNMRVLEASGKLAAVSLSYVAWKRTPEEMEKISKNFRVFKELTNTIPGEYYLDSLAVHPEFRGCGFGEAMLEDTEILAKNRGYDAVHLLVFDNNIPAVKMYEKNGYRTQRSRPAPIDPDIPYTGNVSLYKKTL